MKHQTVLKKLIASMVPLLIVGLGVAGLLLLVRKPPQAAEEPPQPLPPLVETVAIESHHGGLNLSVDGVVVPFREIEIATEVAGRIVRKPPENRAGRYVSAGTILYEIDRRDYELEAERLEAQLEQAESNLEQLGVESENTKRLVTLAQEDQQLADNEVQRLTGLTGGRYVSESELDRAKKSELVARNQVTTLTNQLAISQVRRTGLQSAVKLAQTQLAKARLDLERTTIKAPVDGVIVKDLFEENELVQPGTPVVLIEDTSAVEVLCNLRMEEVSWLWRQGRAGSVSRNPSNLYELPATPVTVTYHFNDRPNVTFEWEGTLSRFDGVGLNEQTRMVPCRVFVTSPREVSLGGTDAENAPPAPALLRGMYVKVSVHVQPESPLLKVAETGLRPGGTVWIAEEGKLQVVPSLRVVELLRDQEGVDMWLVDASASSIQEGDRLIVSPMVVVQDGMPIRTQQVLANRPFEDEVRSQLGDS